MGAYVTPLLGQQEASRRPVRGPPVAIRASKLGFKHKAPRRLTFSCATDVDIVFDAHQ